MKVIIKKHDSVKPAVKDLIDPPVIIRVNKFTEESANKFSEQMSLAHNTGQKVIPVIIDSYGGYVYSLLSMLSEIENSHLPVATIAVGKAMSCGAILLCCGTPGYRYADTNATIMIHDVAAGAVGKIEDMKVSTQQAEKLNQLVFHKMAEKAGHKDKNYFLKHVSNKKHVDWFMSALESKKHKVIDFIGVPHFQVDVNVSMELKLK